jgi:DNA-binding response OmpR family regulator
MSGVELQRHLQLQRCQVPLIFITSFDDEGIRTQALNAGAVCFTKPFEIRTLIKHLEEALKRRPIAPTTAFRTAEQRSEQGLAGAGRIDRSEVPELNQGILSKPTQRPKQPLVEWRRRCFGNN